MVAKDKSAQAQTALERAAARLAGRVFGGLWRPKGQSS